MTTGNKMNKEMEWSLGWKVFIALFVLSVAEVIVTFTIASPMLLLLPLVFAKAALIIWYFMGLGDLRDKETTE